MICIVQVQKQTRLCITRDLTEKDVVSRIMRKENYLIGMLNKVRQPRHLLAPYKCITGSFVKSSMRSPLLAFAF